MAKPRSRVSSGLWVMGRRLAGGRKSVVGLLIASVLLAALACIDPDRATLKSAADAWDSGDYELAAREYERFIAEYPEGDESLHARFQLASIYYLNLRRYEEARVHFRQFLDEAPPGHRDAPPARLRLAEVLGELGRSYEAIAEYENLNPSDRKERRRIRLRIADLYFDQKNYSQALTEYAKVTEEAEFDDLSERAYMREASIYHISRNQYLQALPAYEKLATLSTDPEVRRRALYGIADCKAGVYRFGEAIAALKQITDESAQDYVKQRIAELEEKRREAAQAQTVMKR